MEDTNSISHEPKDGPVPATTSKPITGSLAGISDAMGPLSGYGIYINTGHVRVVRHSDDTPQGE